MGAKIELKNIESENDFFEVLKLEKVVIYFTVNWSGPERASRNLLYKVLNDVEYNGVPVFNIDCSTQNLKYIEDWILNQTKIIEDLYYGGYGETLLLENGQIIDFIKYPAQLGIEGMKDKFNGWMNIK